MQEAATLQSSTSSVFECLYKNVQHIGGVTQQSTTTRCQVIGFRPAIMVDPRISKAIKPNVTSNRQPICMNSSVVWSLLSIFLRPLSTDRSFWWRTTGAVLAETLHQAKYSWMEQCSTLYFYYVFITPRLGPRPREPGCQPRWKSFMTDDFSPLEYSWNWGTSGTKAPEIRYSVEVIGLDAGTPMDPFNQLMTMELVSQLQVSLPRTDWTWFTAFHNAFQTPSLPPVGEKHSLFTLADSETRSSPSSIFLAFEHRRSSSPVPKAYFVPGVRALTTSSSTLDVVNKALANLPTHSSDLRTSFPAYTYLVDFLAHHPLGQPLTLIFLAIDCVPLPQESRLKIYLRSPATDFASVMQILRLGLPINTATSDSTPGNLPSPHQLQRLESLFHALLPLTQSSLSSFPSPSSPAPSCTSSTGSSDRATRLQQPPTHETAGLLYYFDCAPSQSIPRPKLYLPVKHYATSDESAWQALKQWLRRERGEGYVAEWGTRFEMLMRRMGVRSSECGPEGLSEDRGPGAVGGESASRVQTYVSVGFDEGGGLNVTSYFGPRVYAARGS